MKFEDVKTVCDSEAISNLIRIRLDDAEGTCGGAPVPNTNDKGASFLQLEAEDSPMAQVLDIQTAGTTNAAANQALNGLKQDLQRVKNGKIQCDGKSFAASSIDSMQSRMACIEREMDGTAEAGLSQAKCKQTLKMITNRLNNKLRVLGCKLRIPCSKKDATAKASCDV